MVGDQADHEAALALEGAAIAMAERLGDTLAAAGSRNNRACTLRHLGRHDEAYEEFAGVLPTILAGDVPDVVVTSCEDFACVLFDMGRDRDGALLVGAALAERDDAGVPRMELQEAALEPSVSAGRDRLGDRWEPLLDAVPSSASWSPVATALRPATAERHARVTPSSKTTTTEAVRSVWPGWIGIRPPSATDADAE